MDKKIILVMECPRCKGIRKHKHSGCTGRMREVILQLK